MIGWEIGEWARHQYEGDVIIFNSSQRDGCQVAAEQGRATNLQRSLMKVSNVSATCWTSVGMHDSVMLVNVFTQLLKKKKKEEKDQHLSFIQCQNFSRFVCMIHSLARQQKETKPSVIFQDYSRFFVIRHFLGEGEMRGYLSQILNISFPSFSFCFVF